MLYRSLCIKCLKRPEVKSSAPAPAENRRLEYPSVYDDKVYYCPFRDILKMWGGECISPPRNVMT